MQSHPANFFCRDHRYLETLKPAPIERARIKKEPSKRREVKGLGTRESDSQYKTKHLHILATWSDEYYHYRNVPELIGSLFANSPCLTV